MDKHEKFDIEEDWNNFLWKIEEFKSYMVEFFEDNAIKPKVYFFNYIIRNKNCQLIIIIIYNKCTFFANNGV